MTAKEIRDWVRDFRCQMRQELDRLGTTLDAAEAWAVLTGTADPRRVLQEVRDAAAKRGRPALEVQLAAARAVRTAYVAHFLRQGWPAEAAESYALQCLRLHADRCARRGTGDNVSFARELRRAAAE
jgi:hypothetical protein